MQFHTLLPLHNHTELDIMSPTCTNTGAAHVEEYYQDRWKEHITHIQANMTTLHF